MQIVNDILRVIPTMLLFTTLLVMYNILQKNVYYIDLTTI